MMRYDFCSGIGIHSKNNTLLHRNVVVLHISSSTEVILVTVVKQLLLM